MSSPGWAVGPVRHAGRNRRRDPPMNAPALDDAEVETIRLALSSCADDLTSTPSDGLAPEYIHAVENIAKGSVAEWPYTETLGRELMSVGSRLAPGESRFPESIEPYLRPLAASALQRYAMAIEQESGEDFDGVSAEAVEVERAERLAKLLLGLTVRVDARRWSGGWELYALGNEDLVTQVENIDGAPAMVRDLLETEFPGADFSKVVFDVRTVD